HADLGAGLDTRPRLDDSRRVTADDDAAPTLEPQEHRMGPHPAGDRTRCPKSRKCACKTRLAAGGGAAAATSAGPRAPAVGGGTLRPTRRACPRTRERRWPPPPAARAQRPRRFLRRALGADPEVLPGAVPGLLAGAVARDAHLALLHGVRGGRAPAHAVGEHRRTDPPLRRRGHAHR